MSLFNFRGQRREMKEYITDTPSSAHGLSLRGNTELDIRRRSLNMVALIKNTRGLGGD